MTKRSTAFFINGGAGRVIASIPALEKFRKNNPDDNFMIVCEGGTEFYKGHPDLDARAYDVWHKHLFQDKIKDRNCVSPEPYRNWHYYNQKASLAQAFDLEINGGDEPATLDVPTIKLNREEVLNGEITINEVKEITGKDKVVIVQPFGRGISYRDGVFNDSTSRSVEYEDLVNLIKKLHKKGHAVMVMAEMPIDFTASKIEVPVPIPQGITLRQWAGLIKACDYFIGCDSVGQHISYALDVPTTAIIGSTYPINTSHVNSKKVDIIDLGKDKRQYAPIRITPDEQCDRMNDGIMKMREVDVEAVVKSVQNGLKKFPKQEVAIKEKARLQGEGTQQQPEVCPVHGVAHEHGHTHSHATPSMPSVSPAMATSTAMSSQFGVVPPFMKQGNTEKK